MTQQDQGPQPRIEPLSAALGAIVDGVDLALLDDEDVEGIRRSWLAHKVLFFRGQHLGPLEHLDFARRLGEVAVHPYVETVTGSAEVQLLHSERGGRADVWHSDASFEQSPPMATVLRFVSGPPRGGDTMWSNQTMAYAHMSDPLRNVLQGLSAVHSAATFGKPTQHSEHPLVRVHPETGEPALYVNRQFTSHVPQLHPLESAALLEHLYQWSTRPEFVCRWSWREGDVVIWDNRCTQHYAVNDYQEPRIMQRVILRGDQPEGTHAALAHRPAERLSASTGHLHRLAAGASTSDAQPTIST